MPASRPRISSGMVWFQTVLRKMPLIMSAAPATRGRPARTTSLGASPASAIDAAPAHRGHDDRPAVVVEARRPAAGERRDHAADALGGVEQPEQRRLLQHLLGERREQHDRHRHEHGDHVDDVGAEQVAPADGVADAGTIAATLGGSSARSAGSGAVDDEQHRRDRRARRRRPRTPRRRPTVADEHAAERRTEQRADLHAERRHARPPPASSSCRTTRGSSASRLGRCSDWAIVSRKPDDVDGPHLGSVEQRVGEQRRR